MDALGGKCKECGETHVAALSFHHSDPAQKEDLVAELVRGSDWNLIEAEIKKCVLLCENCHRKTHFDAERYRRLYQRIADKAAGLKTGKEIKIKKWNASETQLLVTLYLQNMSVQEIAQRMGRLDCTIRSRLERLKSDGTIGDRDSSEVVRKKSIRITKEIKEQIRSLYKQHLSPLEISSRLGVSLRTVFKYQKGE